MTDDVTVKAELGESSKYFDDGIRLAINVTAEFNVDIGKDGVGQLKFTLNATFLEEIAIDVTVNVTSQWAVIVPTSIRVNTDIDVKNYTALSFEIMVYSVAKEEEDEGFGMNSQNLRRYLMPSTMLKKRSRSSRMTSTRSKSIQRI